MVPKLMKDSAMVIRKERQKVHPMAHLTGMVKDVKMEH